MHGLAVQAKGDGGFGLQSIERDFPSAGSADAVGSIPDSCQGEIDFFKQHRLTPGQLFQKLQGGIISWFVEAIIAFPTEAFLFLLLPVDLISDQLSLFGEARFEFLEFFVSHGHLGLMEV